MEVKINKEIQSYSESMFLGLSMRQCGFSLAAMLVAVGLYFLLKPYVGTETVSWMCILGAAPTTAFTIRSASSGVRIRPQPSPELAIFGIGQPMLMSKKSQPEISRASLAPWAMISGSFPKICAPQRLPSFFRRSRAVFLS